jgi:F-type H+-transporting ATPase subunit delta
MAENITLARPYARAAFELAQDKGALEAWSKTLKLLAELSGDASVQALLSSPKATPALRAAIFAELCARSGEALDAFQGNFVKLLAENRRLPLLSEIAADFETLRAEAENVLEVELRAARPVDAAEQARISAALTAKLKHRITLKYVEDKSLIGGAVIQAGDLVIDGSVRGKLGRLAAALTN